MGWTVLYIAFGIVALWLLGEVLLQYKARLRWRLLAFTGFLGVVVGVLLPSVIVIGIGAIAFAVGQTYVTLSFRKGFAAGWAVKRPVDGEEAAPAKRRGRRGEHQDPVFGAGDTEGDTEGAAYEPPAYAREGADFDDDAYDRDDVFTPVRTPEPGAEATTVYEPQPMPDDTGSYGVYGDQTQGAPQQQPTGEQAYAYDYSGYDQTQQQSYGYDATTGAQGYGTYQDPYAATQTQDYSGYDTSGYAQQQYAQQTQQTYGQDTAYGTGGYGDGQTPAGGVWVPQQRTDEYGGELPQEQPYPYQGQAQQQPNAGYDEQYRY
ncbi:hypothetical protein ABZW47_14535 [Streptomyces sp. NPDC004549]|uniref:SCO2102 family sporulation regulator n=1 Tax=Streptomyces sp. NPDC004549 TaxID=3154283 RepID=UPI0033A18A3C